MTTPNDTSGAPAFPRVASIRARVVLLALAVGTVLLALQGYTAVRQYRQSRDAGVADVIALAERAAAATGQFLVQGRTALESLAAERGRRLLDPGRCLEDVPTIRAAAPFFLNVVVARHEGTVVCSVAPALDPSDVDMSTRPWFPRVRQSRAFTVSPPYLGGISGRPIVVLAAPVLDVDGAFLGVVSASLELEDFQAIVTAAQGREEDLITIADAGRMIVARTHSPQEWVGRALPPPVVPAPSFTLDGRPYTRAPDADGVARVWGEVRVPGAGAGWTVFGAVPDDLVFGRARAVARTQILWALGLVGLAALLAAWTYRGLGRPLVQLAEGARSAAGGAPIPVPVGAPTEVRGLAEEFNQTLEARAQAQLAERRARDRYRTLFDNAAVGIYRSTEGGRFLDVNPALATILGYESPEELRGVDVEGVYRDPGRRAELLEAQGEATSFQDVEVEWVRKDGTPVTLRLTGRIVSDIHAEPVYEVFAQDITRERALREFSRHQQKMEALGRIAGGVSHEFNNLLTVIAVNAEILKRELGESPLREEAEEVERAAERGASLTRKLLAFSRRDVVRPDVVDVNQAVRDSHGMLRRAAGEAVTVGVFLDPDAGPVRVVASHLDQALLNLILNARDAMPEGGRVTVKTETRWGGEDGPVGMERLYTVASVSDEGTGMTPDVSERAFEPFFTTKPVGKGTGLGLAAVQGIVREAGGFAQVESGVGEGCTVELWLPVVEEGEEA